MNISEVKELLALVNESDLTEFDLQIDNTVLHMSKNDTPKPNHVESVTASPVVEAKVNEIAKEATQSNTTTIESNPEAVELGGTLIPSPIVGVVYLTPTPDQPAFKKVGDTVAVGETLCIVEAMKLMNEITSDTAGTIAEVLIENEQVVEYNQPLFRIV
ncbi:acetyl-CoA carboxylase, biotin carboxyl carrier protein [Carnobacterium divergens]|uniref:acetyl-CoA carboxylase biotin carboxyl carrier protein n=1 Tax=Carnobacterium divergens TaxID=2748 RepID=UPI001072821F|nr:acetyl-CoA carboxylase biotin carboxyl carrier protein [Carnobacterium divergens]TFJ44067.1 acetyl-CoA carboxylase, biotin carboxyl carrier protein [Carnobacterium divergens]TFJ51036.1 acetyl-CoA carboxylase, biotin carboxyl carrier protein [Carnobacterium divergens]